MINSTIEVYSIQTYKTDQIGSNQRLIYPDAQSLLSINGSVNTCQAYKKLTATIS